MNKTVPSPVKQFPGSITLYQPLNMLQVMAFEDAIGKASEYKDKPLAAKYQNMLLPGIFECVEKWELKGLENVTVETFPGSPKLAVAELMAWLIKEVMDVYKGEIEIPNA